MKHNWEYKKLPKVATILYGYPFESGKFNSEKRGMPLVRIRDVKPGETETYFDGDYSPEYIIKEGDYLIGMDGEFNIAPWRSVDALLNQRVCRIESDSKKHCLSAFLYYFLGVELKRIEEKTSFVTVKHLSAKVLNNITVPLPSMAVQEQIVAELDKLNEMIATRKEQLKELDNLAQSLFYDTFGDPISNPKGWEISALGLICKLSAGGDKPADTEQEYSEEKCIPIYSNGTANEGLYGYTSTAKIFQPSVTISGRGTIGVPFIRNKPFVPIIRLIVATPSTQINLNYLYHLIKILKLGGNGASIPQLTVPMIKDLFVPVPPLPLQQQFATQVEAIERQKELVEASISELQTLLDSRMDYWFN